MSVQGLGFHGVSNGKESTCNAGDVGSTPGLGRSPGGGHANPLQFSCLENPHGQRSLVGYSPWGHKESDMTERLSSAQFRAAWSKELGSSWGSGVSWAVNQFSGSSWAIDAPPPRFQGFWFPLPHKELNELMNKGCPSPNSDYLPLPWLFHPKREDLLWKVWAPFIF